ncbi:hypothetical protein HN020_03885 [Brevibacillus borstelensis]|uniref:hypothetical protein n=1 Tax=Brevibacillus borstelensis TaxID=45462 RepID=UPI00148FA2F6|nr:hypothetical protein [Brevibacillus borstelensis]MCM3560962.1 hypothetical protein [Brevibacillus borstelensis]MCM3593375.1 hypothetical protein [Brevibacillus borstelensis]MCM3623796.1 hypothetical protein [Brevibacillus borstelensis]NOU53934.1 hypothetical protein [Brevibacillus borstelensis]
MQTGKKTDPLKKRMGMEKPACNNLGGYTVYDYREMKPIHCEIWRISGWDIHEKRHDSGPVLMITGEKEQESLGTKGGRKK